MSHTEPRTIAELIRTFPNYVRNLNDFSCEGQIGKGGFGIVWKGKDAKTGKTVAVKELMTKKLKGKFLTHYIREIQTHASTNCRFVVPLIGFTAEPPYSIITEFMPNGHLGSYILSRKGRDTTSGTHMQSIAVCLAFCLSHIGDLGIVYRDLKSSNILMDDKELPRLCDFGIARFIPEAGLMTRRIGTPQYMSPELINEKRYNQKSDVYAFAMILYEMNEGHFPWPGAEMEQVVEYIAYKNERPDMSNAPRDMRNLINRCWAPNPKDRPSFKDIYKELGSCKTTFPKTDKKKIKKLCDSIEDNDKKRSAKGKELPQIFEDWQRIARRLDSSDGSDDEYDDMDISDDVLRAQLGEDSTTSSGKGHTSQKSPKPEKSGPDFSLLKRSSSSSWNDNLKKVAQTLTPDGFDAFYDSIIGLASNAQNAPHIVNAMKTVIERYPAFLDFLQQHSFFARLGMFPPEAAQASCGLLATIFDRYPEKVTADFVGLVQRMASTNATDLIYAISYLAKNNPNTPVAIQIYDILIQYAKLFEGEGVTPMLLTLLASLIQINANFYTRYRDPIMRLFNSYLTHPDLNVVNVALRCTAAAYNKSYQLDIPSIVTRVTGHPEVYESAASLLLRVTPMPTSRPLMMLLMTISKERETGHFALVNYISSSFENAQMVAQCGEWYDQLMPTIEANFRLLVLLFMYPALRFAIARYMAFPRLCIRLAESGEGLYLISLASILRRASIDSFVVERLNQAGFIRAYISAISASNDTTVIMNGITCLDTMTRAGPSDDYALAVPFLKTVMSNHPELSPAVISYLTIMSPIKASHQALRSAGMVEYFQTLLSIDTYKAYATQFLANLDAQ